MIDNIFNIDVVSPNFDLNNNVSDIDDNLNTDSDVDTNIDSDTDSSLGKKIVGFAKKVGKAVLTTYLTSLGMMAISGLLDGIETMESVSEASDDVLDSFFDNDNNDDNVDDDGEIFASPSDDFDENDFSNDFLESIEDDVNLNDEISNDNIINDIFEENIIVGEKNSISNEIYSDENSDIESNLKDNIGEDNNDVLDEKFNFSEGFILPSINRKNNNSKTKLVSLLSLFGLLSASGVVMYNSKKKDEEELDDESILDDEEILSDIDSAYEKPTFYSDNFKN